MWFICQLLNWLYFPSPLQYGTKALDKITKAILGHIENKVPSPKGYPGGDAMFFRGRFVSAASLGNIDLYHIPLPASASQLVSSLCELLSSSRNENWHDGCGHLLSGGALWDQY